MPIPVMALSGEAVTTTSMAGFLSTVTEVFTSVMSWTGTVAETVMSTPVYLVPVVTGIALIGIGIFKRLSS